MLHGDRCLPGWTGLKQQERRRQSCLLNCCKRFETLKASLDLPDRQTDKFPPHDLIYSAGLGCNGPLDGSARGGGGRPGGYFAARFIPWRPIAISLLLLAAVSGCGSTNDGSAAEGRPGNQAVYLRIAQIRSCDRLQGEFDRAMDNADARPAGDGLRDISLSYADAAEARMQDLDCP